MVVIDDDGDPVALDEIESSEYSIPDEMRLWGEKIPNEINLWGWDKYYGLSIANLRCISLHEELYLRGEHLICLNNKPVNKGWAQFRVRTLRVDPTRSTKKEKDRRILATAKLVYPYIYKIEP